MLKRQLFAAVSCLSMMVGLQISLPAHAEQVATNAGLVTFRPTAPSIRSLLPDDSLQEYCRDVRVNAIVIPSFCSLLSNAQTNYRQGNFQGAVNLYDRVLSQNPAYSKGYYNRAMANLALGKVESARLDLAKAVSLFQTQKDLSNQQEALAVLATIGS
jgi:tetratricopeptide (TPR) repeat protein